MFPRFQTKGSEKGEHISQDFRPKRVRKASTFSRFQTKEVRKASTLARFQTKGSEKGEHIFKISD